MMRRATIRYTKPTWCVCGQLKDTLASQADKTELEEISVRAFLRYEPNHNTVTRILEAIEQRY